MDAFKGYYARHISGAIVRVINASVDGTALRIRTCQLGQAFSGGGTLVGQDIRIVGEAKWVKAGNFTRIARGQNGVLWS